MRYFIQIIIIFTLSIFLFSHYVSQYAAGSILSGLHVKGNKIVNHLGQQVILRGINRSGTEYMCINGNGIFDGHSDNASVQAIKNWGINEVNIPINEDCWLGINGVPFAIGGINYQQAIINYTKLLEGSGIYPVISMFWNASGTHRATGIAPMPDADHAVDLWKSLAGVFKADTAVIFRLAEEPYPANNSDTSSAWQCWKDGGASCNEGYKVVGFQDLLNTVRSAGAKNIVQLSGVQYANSMSQFLKYKPSDPEGNSMAVVDIYPDLNPCGNIDCYDREYAPIIGKIPLMAGEFGESVNGNICSIEKSNILMDWFDQHNSGYSAWTWNTWGNNCGNLSLIADYDGTPHSPNGINYKSHLSEVLSKPIPSQAQPTILVSPMVTQTCSSGWSCFVSTLAASLQSLQNLVLSLFKYPHYQN